MWILQVKAFLEAHEDEIKKEVAVLFPPDTDLEAVGVKLKEAAMAKEGSQEKVMAVLKEFNFNFEAVKEEVSLI